MSSYEVPEPIINLPFEEPTRFWYIREGEEPQLREGRRPAVVYPPREERDVRGTEWDLSDGMLRPSEDYAPGYEMVMVNLIRERVKAWREQGYPGVTRTTLELLQWWRRDGREKRLFFAQLEAAETIIFLTEARQDFLQGIQVPADEPSDTQKAEGIRVFQRWACKMATGAGKTMVMGMLAAWSVINKVNDRSDGRFSDVVLVVCPNVTIRNRLRELAPDTGDASIYRTRDLVPDHLMPLLRRGRVLVTNWHIFELRAIQVGGTPAKVSKVGRPVRTRETIRVGSKTTTARGKRYLTEKDLRVQVATGMVSVLEEERDRQGQLTSVKVEATRYVESDTAWIKRVLGREVGGKQNVLIFNDEAHHAYRIRREPQDLEEEDLFGEMEEAEEYFQEATVWIDGLDRINRMRGINFCVDLSATPYYLGRVGQDTNKPFPWVVSDFGLVDAIESGLVKIPQLAIRDTTGDEIPGYSNIWRWIMKQLTSAERGGRRADPKPAAILKWAQTPITMLGGLWEEELQRWGENEQESRPPVFILVCKNTKIAKVIYEWLAEDKQPAGIPPAKLEKFRNTDGQINTIRVDSKVIHETDTGEAKSDEYKWMRLRLDTVGKTEWPADPQGRPIYPEGFEELAKRLGRPLHPPGRDVRCIVSVGMLTEGWDCNTVTHIIGLRPFMSQLLCEQVVGRGLRRSTYDDFREDGKLTEQVAKVFGVPFEVIPYKQSPTGPAPPPPPRHHIHALPGKVEYKITFPRVEGYTQAIRNRIVVDWERAPSLVLDERIPSEVEVKGMSITYQGRRSLTGPGRMEKVELEAYRAKVRVQEVIFDVARGLTRYYLGQARCDVPAHKLFPQLVRIVQQYVAEKVFARPPRDLKDLALSPYYGWLVERLAESIGPDTAQGEAPEVPCYEANREPGSTEEVGFWTSRDVREVVHSHLNYVVADTKRWEQAAAYYIDKHPATAAFAKNAGLGFVIPYLHNGQMHDYIPDFIIRLKANTGGEHCYLILETKGFDPLEEVKSEAAERWANAVNADGTYGHWQYAIARKPEEVNQRLDAALAEILN